jgi:hypothetical protein
MTKVLAGITTSVDGYVAGPDDGPGKGLGEGGERLHYWVFGGPWTYAADGRGNGRGRGVAGRDQLFDGFTKSLDLEHIGVRQSAFATFIDYRVTSADA